MSYNMVQIITGYMYYDNVSSFGIPGISVGQNFILNMVLGCNCSNHIFFVLVDFWGGGGGFCEWAIKFFVIVFS